METKKAVFPAITIPVAGMSCGSCVRRIQTALAGDAGVKAVEVDLAAGEVTVAYNPQSTAPAAISEAIRKSGYKPGIPRGEQ